MRRTVGAGLDGGFRPGLYEVAATLGRGGLCRRLAAYAHHHRQAGYPWETHQSAISVTMRGILATHGKPARPAAALTSAEVKRLLASCGADVAGVRDKALLLVGFAGALRRSELVGEAPIISISIVTTGKDSPAGPSTLPAA